MERVSVLALAAGLLRAAQSETRGRNEIENWQGEWVMVSRESDGTPWPAEEVQRYRRHVKGYRFFLSRDGIPIARGVLIPDAARALKTLDVIRSEGEHRGQVRLGIYVTDGDFQQVCLGAPDGSRPTDFSTGAGSGRWLTVWKRIPPKVG